MKPISTKQIQIIKMAAKQLGLDDATYRDMLWERYRVRSCTALDRRQADDLIDDFQKKGFHLQSKRRPWPPVRGGTRAPRAQGTPREGKVVGLASRDELEKIAALADLITWRAENGLALFFEKRLGIAGGRVRTAREAYLAIESLKKLFENGMKKQYGPDWWLRPFADTAISDYIARHAPAEFQEALAMRRAMAQRGGPHA